MFKKILILSLFICFASRPVFAINEREYDNHDAKDSLHLNAIYVISNIVININGTPKQQEEQELRDIINSDTTSQTERRLARALLFMDRQVRESDKKELLKFKTDQANPTHIQILADIIYRLYNQASPEDKKKLRNIFD